MHLGRYVVRNKVRFQSSITRKDQQLCMYVRSRNIDILDGTEDQNVSSCTLFCILYCPLSYPLSPFMEVVGSLICMATFPLAADAAAHCAVHFFIFGIGGLPTDLPTVSIYGSGGQLNLHGKIPMCSPLRCQLCCPLFHIWN